MCGWWWGKGGLVVGFGSCAGLVVANHKKAVRGRGCGGWRLGQIEGEGGAGRHMLSRGLDQDESSTGLDLRQLPTPGTGCLSLEGVPSSRMPVQTLCQIPTATISSAARNTPEPCRAHTSTSSLPCSGCSPRRDSELNENTCHTAVD